MKEKNSEMNSSELNDTESSTYFSERRKNKDQKDLSGIEIPEEIKRFCRQGYEKIKKEEDLTVMYGALPITRGEGKQIYVDILDNIQTTNSFLTAILDENGAILKYTYNGSEYTGLYEFINYLEGSTTISDEFKQLVSEDSLGKNGEEEYTGVHREYIGEKYKYELDQNILRGGSKSRFWARITPKE